MIDRRKMAEEIILNNHISAKGAGASFEARQSRGISANTVWFSDRSLWITVDSGV
jgi:hypothetical protein